MLTHVAAEGRAGMSDLTGGGSDGNSAVSQVVLISGASPRSAMCRPCVNTLTWYVGPVPATVFPLSRKLARIGTPEQTTFSRLISVRALFSSLMISAGPATSSSRESFIQSSSARFSRMAMAVGTPLNWLRMIVRPPSSVSMAACRWPSNEESISRNGQLGEGLCIVMPNSPPKKCKSSASLPTSSMPARPEPIRKLMCAR